MALFKVTVTQLSLSTPTGSHEPPTLHSSERTDMSFEVSAEGIREAKRAAKQRFDAKHGENLCRRATNISDGGIKLSFIPKSQLPPMPNFAPMTRPRRV